MSAQLLGRTVRGSVLCDIGAASCRLASRHSIVRPGRRRAVRVRAESPIVEEMSHAPPLKNPVFNPTRWRYHQDTSRYARHLQSIFRSVTFRNLQAPLSFLTLVACLVVLYRTSVDTGQLPDLFEGVRFTDVPFQLTSFALSLLLVFRTDAGYDRWCKAMDAWGTLRTSSAGVVRKAAAWVGDTAHLRRLVRWVAAFPLCLMLELRHDQGEPGMEAAMRAELQGLLLPHELKQVLAAGPYYHQFCLSVLTALVEAAQLGESREAAMLEDLQGFNDAACECEKILRFPIPLTYTRHTSRFMLIYLGALPLALYDSCDWAVIPVTMVISFLLLGIEDIGVQIEEPFSILPLPDICTDLRITAQRAVAQRGMVRCLADPTACTVYPEDLDAPAAASVASAGGITVGGGGSGCGGAAGIRSAAGGGALGPELDPDTGEALVLEPSFAGGGNGGGGGGAAAAGGALSSRSRQQKGEAKGPGLVAAMAEGGDGSRHSYMNGNGIGNDNGNGSGKGNGKGNGNGRIGSGWPHRP